MAIKEIIKVPDERLNKKSIPIKIETEISDLKALVQDLIDTLENSKTRGAGLAAPQIGVLKRVCIAKKYSIDPKDPNNELESNFILINPIILNKSEVTHIGWEGCLSIPDTYGEVDRSKRLKVEAYDVNGNKYTLKAEGFFARVIQHEIDHLDGILFTSKLVGKTVTEKELDEIFKKEEGLLNG